MQGDVNDKMRAILIDWLVDVHLKFKVGRSTAAGRMADHVMTTVAALAAAEA